MELFPAIDLRGGAAVRLLRGDYKQMTVYSTSPVEVAKSFAAAGARYLHLVDLDGAKDGGTPNCELIAQIVSESGLLTEVGGGIRNMQAVEHYLNAGARRVIIGSAAVTDPDFLREALLRFGEKIAVGVDLKDGCVAIHGWTETSRLDGYAFIESMQEMGVKTIICTDISKDGAMVGTNRELYRELSRQFSVNIIASGGVSSIEDVKALKEMSLYGAIIGKAYYTKAISLKEAIEVGR